MAKRIAHEKNLSDYSNARATAIRLIATDELEKGTDHGQTVSKIFHDADLIINKDLIEVNTVARQVHRFCELLFSSNSISPTRYEYGMFAAKAAALRTLDLSRQVGAAIFGNDGCIATMGSNEVPKAHGGTYWADDGPFDAREYALGTDSNDARKRELWQKSFLTQSHRLRPLTNFSFRKPSKIRNSWAH